MNFNKTFFKISFVLSIILVIFVLTPLIVSVKAQGEPQLMPIPEITDFNVFNLLWRAVNWFFNIVIILGIIFIIFAGFKYVTSGGDPDNTKKAMTILVYALIGIAIALLAKALINFVAEWLGAGKLPLEGTTLEGTSGGTGGTAGGTGGGSPAGKPNDTLPPGLWENLPIFLPTNQ